MVFIATGLTNGGITTHYAFSYDDSLQQTAANPTGPEPARTNALIAAGGRNSPTALFRLTHRPAA
jgi:hypothetical protein